MHLLMTECENRNTNQSLCNVANVFKGEIIQKPTTQAIPIIKANKDF